MAESRSILAADFGSVYTRLLLFEVVGGAYRVVAKADVRSTGGFPAGDVTLGLRQAAERVQRTTGRKLLDKTGRIITPEGDNRIGVDVFVATASGGRPIQTVLVGLMPDVSIRSGIRTTEGTYVDLVETLTLKDNRNEQDQLNAILISNPDLIFVTGGTEDGATNPIRKMLGLVKTALSATETDNRPALLYAGNSALTEEVEAEFGELTRVFIADNVRPALEVEDLDAAQLQLGLAFDRYMHEQGNGFDRIGEWSSMGLLPTAQSYSIITEYIGKTRQKDQHGVAVLDVGSASATLASYADGDLKTTIRTDMGIGTSAPALLNTVDLDALRRWIPFSIARADLQNYALNKQLRPASIPMSRKELYIEHALMRAGVATMVREQRPAWAESATTALHQIIGAGGVFTGTGNPGMTALLLANALQPRGVTALYADPNSVIATLGALAYVAPEAVVQLLGSNSLEPIGTLFAVDKYVANAKITVRIEYDDNSYEEQDIIAGLFLVLPLAIGKTATVKIQAKGGLRINGQRRLSQTVTGGTAGILIDTRGRPIMLNDSLEQRMRQITAWYEGATYTDHANLPQADLAPVEEREAVSLALAGAEMPDLNVDDLADLDAPPAPAPTVDDLLGGDEVDMDELETLFEEDDDDDPFANL